MAKRDPVSMHAAGVDIAGASSYADAGLIGESVGPSAVFLFDGLAGLTALVIAWSVMTKSPPAQAKGAGSRALLDFRPVLRHWPAKAWIAGYTVHIRETAALRAWGAIFLTIVAARRGIAELAARRQHC